jgi:hypothetical protein
MSRWDTWILRALAVQAMTTKEIFAWVQERVSFRFGRPTHVRSAIESACDRLRESGVLERHQSGRNGIRRWELAASEAA